MVQKRVLVLKDCSLSTGLEQHLVKMGQRINVRFDNDAQFASFVNMGILAEDKGQSIPVIKTSTVKPTEPELEVPEREVQVDDDFVEIPSSKETNMVQEIEEESVVKETIVCDNCGEEMVEIASDRPKVKRFECPVCGNKQYKS